jgi:hypothetical protein
MNITDYQEKELQWHHFRGVPRGMRDPRPFYWSSLGRDGSAPSGWYEWTPQGLVYLGESILERA